MTPFADLALSRRLEATEGHGGAAFAEARCRLDPEARSESIEVGGAVAIYDGVDSPMTQSFGLGLASAAHEEDLEVLEAFFAARGAGVDHEVSPLAGEELFLRLAERGYRPIELTSVLYRSLNTPQTMDRCRGIRVRLIDPSESDLWSEVCAEGWRQEAPELFDFLLAIGRINTVRSDSHCFVAEIDGAAVAAGLLVLREGVALLSGASTVPRWRRRGAQGVLLDARLRYASQQGCDLAMVCAKPGSASQRNAEREGFRIAYTRTKWRLGREERG